MKDKKAGLFKEQLFMFWKLCSKAMQYFSNDMTSSKFDSQSNNSNSICRNNWSFRFTATYFSGLGYFIESINNVSGTFAVDQSYWEIRTQTGPTTVGKIIIYFVSFLSLHLYMYKIKEVIWYDNSSYCQYHKVCHTQKKAVTKIPLKLDLIFVKYTNLRICVY
jgi:hypothetical protein